MRLSQIVFRINVRAPGKSDYGTTHNAAGDLEIELDFDRRVIWLRNGARVKGVGFEAMAEFTPADSVPTEPVLAQSSQGQVQATSLAAMKAQQQAGKR
jgi:hypothetical protein